MEHLRLPLATVFQSMVSAASYIYRGRRELARKFVNPETAPRLYANKPTCRCYFGHSSLSEAVADAVEAKKVNKDLVAPPKKPRTQFFRKPHSYGFGSSYKSRFDNFSRSNQSYSNKGKFQNNKQTSQRSGKKRGGRGQSQRRRAKKSSD